MWSEEAPRDAALTREVADPMEAKRRLLAAVDDLRATPGGTGESLAVAATIDDVRVLRRKLGEAEAAKHMLEDEVRMLEQRALSAIAEMGRLRRALDEATGGAELEVDGQGNWRRERLDLRKGLEAAQLERNLLTSALTDSESELARMARTIDLMARKLHIAS